MAAVVGSILATLTADAAPLGAGLRVGEKYIQTFERRVGADLKKIDRRTEHTLGLVGRAGITGFGNLAKGALAAAVPLLSFGAAVNQVTASLEKFGNIADLSAAAGLDSEFFQSIAYQASLAGVGIETMGTALAAFAKSSGQAEAGTGRLASTLARLHPALLDGIQAATSQEERFRLVVEALSKIEDPARRAAIAVAAFGESGGKIASAFAGGAAAIDETMRKARELGIIVEREVVARADEFGDQFDTAAQIVDTRLKAAFVNLAPALVSVAGWAAEFTRLMGVAADQLRDVEERTHLRPLQNELAGVENQIATLKEQIAAARKSDAEGGLLEGIFGWDEGDFREADARLEGLYQHALRLQERIKTLLSKPASVPPPLPDISDDGLPSLSKIKDDVKPVEIGIGRITAGVRELDGAASVMVDGLSSGLADVVKSLARGEDAVGALSNAFGNLGDRLIDLAINQAVQSLLGGLTKAIFGVASPGNFSIAGIGPTYASGGFTGFGGKYEPAGLVHRGEFVMNADATKRLGVGFLSGLNSYAGGGFVSPSLPSVPHFVSAPANDFEPAAPIVVNISTTVDARGSNLTEGQIKAMLDRRDKALAKAVPAALADARRRGAA